jgi:RNA polymerase sigma-70 factor (ECF subfamily)
MVNEKLDFDKLVRDNKVLLERLSGKLEKNPVDAEDLLQDALIKAFSNFHKYEPKFKFSSWFSVIIKNTYIDKYRKRKDFIFNAIESEDADSSSVFQNNDHERSMMKIHYEEMMSHAKEVLGDKLMAPFELWIYNYKENEISEKLDIPIGTVKSRVSAAKSKIAKTFPFYFCKVEKNR